MPVDFHSLVRPKGPKFSVLPEGRASEIQKIAQIGLTINVALNIYRVLLMWIVRSVLEPYLESTEWEEGSQHHGP
jgi:hypothetical protein